MLLAAVFGLAGDAFNPPARQWSATAAVAAIDAYRATVSPVLEKTKLIRCRFEPTCSAYGREAVRRFGFLHGGALAAWRVVRCNPLSKGGYDPVTSPPTPLQLERGGQRPGRGGAAGKSAAPSRSRSS